MIIFPKPYHSPPAPTKLDSFTLRGSALSAFLTRVPKGVGIVKSAQSLMIGLFFVLVPNEDDSDAREQHNVGQPYWYWCFCQGFNLVWL
jgi:hypothetical protein